MAGIISFCVSATLPLFVLVRALVPLA
jgi:hypothetical protein